jgi:hypothetical protein
MKKTYYEFPKTTTSFNIMYDVDIIRGHSIDDIDTDFEFTYEPSNNIKRLLDGVDEYNFFKDLYSFVKNYNTKFKNIKMKKEYHSTNGMNGKPSAPIMVFVEMKRGKCKVSYSPVLQEDGYDDNVMDSFVIDIDDVLKFLNKWSKKTDFQNDSIIKFGFSWCLNQIEEIGHTQNSWDIDCKKLLNKLMKTNKIIKGERCEGEVSYNSDKKDITYKVDYRYCREIGEDWDTDVWVDKVVKIKLK